MENQPINAKVGNILKKNQKTFLFTMPMMEIDGKKNFGDLTIGGIAELSEGFGDPYIRLTFKRAYLDVNEVTPLFNWMMAYSFNNNHQVEKATMAHARKMFGLDSEMTLEFTINPDKSIAL